MSKGARIKAQRAEGTDRNHIVVSKETNPRTMNNPANADKARMLNRAKAKNKIAKTSAGTKAVFK